MPKTNLEIILQNTRETQKQDLYYSGPTMLDCGLSILGLSPGWGHCIVFLQNTLKFTPTVLLSTQEISTGKLKQEFSLSLQVDSVDYFLLFLATCYYRKRNSCFLEL